VREALLSLLQLVLGLPVLKSALLTLSPQLLQPTLRVLQRKERALGLQGRVFLRAVGVDLGPDGVDNLVELELLDAVLTRGTVDGVRLLPFGLRGVLVGPGEFVRLTLQLPLRLSLLDVGLSGPITLGGGSPQPS